MTAKDLAKQWGFLYEEEVDALKKTILTLGDNSVCINIGAGVGTSGMVFMECKNVGNLYTIDITREASPFGGLGNENITFKEAGYANDPRHHQICGDSTEVGKMWNGGLVDMVFIDGDHSYAHCSSDIMAWLPHIKDNGIICLHDYESHFWPTVTKSVDDILKDKYETISQARTFIAFRVK